MYPNRRLERFEKTNLQDSSKNHLGEKERQEPVIKNHKHQHLSIDLTNLINRFLES